MTHEEFSIGEEFQTATGRWRCTDVGTRTIAAIKIDESRDASWLAGPPYAVEEVIFDENDMAGCWQEQGLKPY